MSNPCQKHTSICTCCTCFCGVKMTGRSQACSYPCLVRDGDAESREVAVPVCGDEPREVVHQEGQVHAVEAGRGHGGVVQRRAPAVADRVAHHAKHLHAGSSRLRDVMEMGLLLLPVFRHFAS